MSLFSFLNPAPFRDLALEGAVKLWFNFTQKRYGQMTSIKIDSTAKFIHVELDLKGESSPIEIDIKSYKLDTSGGNTSITLGEIKTSREWITELINDYLPAEKKCFPVPDKVKWIL